MFRGKKVDLGSFEIIKGVFVWVCDVKEFVVLFVSVWFFDE